MESATLAPILCSVSLSPNSPEALDRAYRIEELVGSLDQVELPVEHAFHAGMYARTLRLPQDIVVTGSLMKVPTLLVFHGHAMVLVGDEWVEICGYGVLTGEAGRKQVVVTRSSVEVTMIFPTQAKTVDEAEREFTDEFEKLMSRKGGRDEDAVAEG